LGNRALIEKEGTDIRQHSLIRDIAYDLLREDVPVWETSECQAAHLWLTAYEPVPNASNLETVRGYLEAFDHYCEARDWDAARELFTNPIDTPVKATLSWHLDIWGYFQEEIRLCQKLLGKCGSDIDFKCWDGIGNGYVDLGNYPKTIEAHEHCLRIAREIDDRQDEGDALGSLGIVYYCLGQYERAIDYLQQALTIVQEIDDRRGEVSDLNSLGVAYSNLGQYERAIDYHQQCLTIAREIGDRTGEAIALGNLGSACCTSGNYLKALELQEQKLVIAREICSRQTESHALSGLGEVFTKLEQYPDALKALQSALEICQETGERPLEAEVFKNLAELHQKTASIDLAQQYCDRALALAIALGTLLQEECQKLKAELEMGGG
jgi:tetratricopeptide (TPR) repeat protein